jgi:hypothetical protein
MEQASTMRIARAASVLEKSSKARTSGNRGRVRYCARPLNSRLGGVSFLIREAVLVL